jgi:uncharacterized OsmC-like protein
VENGKKDKSALIKPIKLQGEWVLDSNKGYQFRTELGYEKGKQTIQIDSPSYLGGNGNTPGPMAYCITGITSCFLATFASVAAMEGIRLTKLKISTECNVNFAKTFDVYDEPITEAIISQIEAESDNADKEKLRWVLEMAKERCPAVYSMSHILKFDTEIK